MTTKGECASKYPTWPPRLLQDESALLPDKIPPVRLRHGQALWLLTELGYRGAASDSTFYEYIKSLRKLGIPFGDERFLTKRGRRLAEYSYCRIMELALTLSLRAYHAVPDSVLRGVIRYRRHLDRFYWRAYAERDSGAGRPIVVEVVDHKPIVFRGLFLDLNMNFNGGDLVRFGPPKLLPAIEALQRFSQSTAIAAPFIPMSLSILSEQIISLALRAPDIRSGPRPHYANKASSGRRGRQDSGGTWAAGKQHDA